MRNNKKQIQGYVACQHCGKPSPVYLPSGGPRKNTFYYVCSEHSNQQGAGVHEYCSEHLVKELDNFAEKYDAADECQALRAELENAGILETVIQTEPTGEDVVVVDENDDEDLLIDNDTGKPIEPVEEKQEETEPNQSGSGFVFLLILGLLLVSGAGYFLVKKFKNRKQSVNTEKPEATPEPTEPKPETPTAETGLPKGILL